MMDRIPRSASLYQEKPLGQDELAGSHLPLRTVLGAASKTDVVAAMPCLLHFFASAIQCNLLQFTSVILVSGMVSLIVSTHLSA